MSLSDITERENDRRLRRDIRNVMPLLSNQSILMLCEAIASAGPRAAADTIISIIGPEEARPAMVLPDAWDPGDLADPATVAQILTALGLVAGKVGATKDQAKAGLGLLNLDEHDRVRVVNEIEHAAVGAVEWGLLGRMIMNVGISLLSRKLPALRYATRVPGLLRLGATAAGAVGGATSSIFGDEDKK